MQRKVRDLNSEFQNTWEPAIPGSRQHTVLIVKDVRPYESADIRFTIKDNLLYAFVMDTPTADITINSLGKSSSINDRKIKKITILGSEEKLKWKQQDDALVITLPSDLPEWKVVGFKIELK